MADLLTHALVGYAVATALSWRYAAVTPPFVTLAMVGAVSPDLNRVDLLLPEATVATLLGVPWLWAPLHRLGGSLLVVALGATLVPRRRRRLALAVLAVGAGSHYALDLLLYKPSGLSFVALWPFTDHRFAVKGSYLSTDRWPAAAAAVTALGTWLVDRRRTDPTGN
jgi:hypothetical protein